MSTKRAWVGRHRAHPVALQALHRHWLVPPGSQELGQADRVVPVGLVDPQRCIPGVPRVDHHDWQAFATQRMKQPGRTRAALQTNQLSIRHLRPDKFGNAAGISRNDRLPNDAALFRHRADQDCFRERSSATYCFTVALLRVR
jgi:hypothetical protein